MTETLVSPPIWRDYIQTTKPRVVLLMLLCALVGMFLATPAVPDITIVVPALLGIALVAASAAVVNHIADAELDLRMARTRDRPVAQGRVSFFASCAFSAALGLSGMTILLLWVNPLTAWLNLASWIGYAVIYTFYLKHATPQNIVIGGLYGAAPPLFGWTAVTNSLDLGGVLLVLIIFLWTPPHFWALALDRKSDYEEVGVPMLPVTHGEPYTRRQIAYYVIALMIASVLPVFLGVNGVLYLTCAVVLGMIFLYLSIALIREREQAPRQTFRYSIFYLTALFIAMLVDHFVMTA